MSYFHAEKERPHWLMPVLLFALTALIFLAALNSLSTRNHAREKELLEDALARDITECYADTGRYPQSLEEIKENYGLTYDADTFFVDYRVIGANLRPTVVVIERNAS